VKAQATQAARKLPSARAEHVSIESDPHSFPAVPAQQRVRLKYQLSSALRSCSTEIALLEDHYLSVRSQRLGTPPVKYVFDLRFVRAKPARVRNVAWMWIVASVVSAAITGAAAWLATQSATPWTSPACFGAVIGVIAAGAAAFFALRQTSESLQFVSVHGDVPLVSIVGGIGSTKSGKRFFIEMIKSINTAKVARPQLAAHLLRDEMREHHRLHELKVLSDEQYAASKTRILQAHE
jgi:hypothetical protein